MSWAWRGAFERTEEGSGLPDGGLCYLSLIVGTRPSRWRFLNMPFSGLSFDSLPAAEISGTVSGRSALPAPDFRYRSGRHLDCRNTMSLRDHEKGLIAELERIDALIAQCVEGQIDGGTFIKL